ncbi:hypothetical protein PGTUg99_006527 [Puccinia graminis f. sp. tritici]|nr:hypothetical protein PGTUg99_006527 [Puccinia graminis f. sp. tritici]
MVDVEFPLPIPRYCRSGDGLSSWPPDVPPPPSEGFSGIRLGVCNLFLDAPARVHTRSTSQPPVHSECRCRMLTEPLRMIHDLLVPRSQNFQG